MAILAFDPTECLRSRLVENLAASHRTKEEQAAGGMSTA